ncbi:MAG: hypothetical protein P8J86_10585 [Phycisphaerales bacterium]|nr:hypothetical protein [Phycisphaerales bacterium]
MRIQVKSDSSFRSRCFYAAAVGIGILAINGCHSQQSKTTDQINLPPVSEEKFSVEPVSKAVMFLQGSLISMRDEATQLQIMGRQLSTSEEKMIASILRFQDLVERVTVNLESAAATMGMATVSIASSPPPDHRVSGGLENAKEQVRKAIDELQQSASSIQVVGRSLSQKEMAFASAMDTAALQLEGGLANLSESDGFREDPGHFDLGQEP